MKVIKAILKWYYSVVPTYERTELGCFTWTAADQMIKEQVNRPDHEKWVIAKEEDMNHRVGIVWLEKRKRIVE